VKMFRKTSVKILTIMSLLLLASCASEAPRNPAQNDVIRGSAMITNMKKSSGGTGIILRSSESSSLLLTNSHVCHVVENGGLVTTDKGSFMVTGYKHSQKYDLCLIKVDKDLGYNTKISKRASSSYYEDATVAGHPALYPTVVTRGHVSGRQSISIMVGVKPCTADDLNDPDKSMFCAFAGGLPIIKEFDSVLVTATIMPGSSGSGVYNKDLELAGVVFAGSGDLGYAWTVPYEAMRNFISEEQKGLKFVSPSNTVDLFGQNGRRSEVSDVEAKIAELCATSDKQPVKDICKTFQSNMIWHK
jgi:S1-C subfamily serine protease